MGEPRLVASQCVWYGIAWCGMPWCCISRSNEGKGGHVAPQALQAQAREVRSSAEAESRSGRGHACNQCSAVQCIPQNRTAVPVPVQRQSQSQNHSLRPFPAHPPLCPPPPPSPSPTRQRLPTRETLPREPCPARQSSHPTVGIPEAQALTSGCSARRVSLRGRRRLLGCVRGPDAP